MKKIKLKIIKNSNFNIFRTRDGRRQGRNAYKTRRNRRLDGTRRRRWGTTEP